MPQVVYKYLAERDPAFKVVLSAVRVAGGIGTVAFATKAAAHKIASWFGHGHLNVAKSEEERGEEEIETKASTSVRHCIYPPMPLSLMTKAPKPRV